MFWTFVDSDGLEHDRVIIRGAPAHHLSRVLRVRTGERGVVVAGSQEHDVEVLDIRRQEVVARIVGTRPVGNEPLAHITLLQALLPNPDFDAVIETATAVGVSRFVAIQAARSVAHPPAERLQRWSKIARSAAEQSHRGVVPTVAGPVPLESALSTELTANPLLLVLEPTAPERLTTPTLQSSRYALAVGPEGGWTSEEIEKMLAVGGIGVNLGPRILRARLAPVVAAAILVQQS